MGKAHLQPSQSMVPVARLCLPVQPCSVAMPHIGVRGNFPSSPILLGIYRRQSALAIAKRLERPQRTSPSMPSIGTWLQECRRPSYILGLNPRDCSSGEQKPAWLEFLLDSAPHPVECGVELLRVGSQRPGAIRPSVLQFDV